MKNDLFVYLLFTPSVTITLSRKKKKIMAKYRISFVSLTTLINDTNLSCTIKNQY